MPKQSIGTWDSVALTHRDAKEGFLSSRGSTCRFFVPNLNRGRLHKQISVIFFCVALNGVLSIEINDGVLESAEQDQTARTCRLILLYTLSKI